MTASSAEQSLPVHNPGRSRGYEAVDPTSCLRLCGALYPLDCSRLSQVNQGCLKLGKRMIKDIRKSDASRV